MPPISSLVKAAEDAPRPYQFVVLLGDHGQSLGATFLQRYGKTLQAHVAKLMGGAKDVEAATGRVEEWGPINAAVTEAARSGGRDRARSPAPPPAGRRRRARSTSRPTVSARARATRSRPASRPSWSSAPAATLA